MALCTADFETGANGATISTGDTGSATAFNAVATTVSGVAEYSNTHAYGTLAGRFAAGGGVDGYGYVEWSTALGTVTDHYGRIYLYLTASPVGQLPIIFGGQGNTRGFRIDITPSGTLAGFDNPAAALFPTFSTAVALNQWVRIEWHIVQSATVGQAEVKLFNAADSTTATETQSGTNKNTLANIDNMKLGAGGPEGPAGAGFALWLDNIVAGATSYPGPADAGALAPWLKTL